MPPMSPAFGCPAVPSLKKNEKTSGAPTGVDEQPRPGPRRTWRHWRGSPHWRPGGLSPPRAPHREPHPTRDGRSSTLASSGRRRRGYPAPCRTSGSQPGDPTPMRARHRRRCRRCPRARRQSRAASAAPTPRVSAPAPSQPYGCRLRRLWRVRPLPPRLPTVIRPEFRATAVPIRRSRSDNQRPDSQLFDHRAAQSAHLCCPPGSNGDQRP